MKDQNVRRLLGKMVASGEIKKVGRGNYQIPRPTGAEGKASQ
jgi:hypothetical protein